MSRTHVFGFVAGAIDNSPATIDNSPFMGFQLLTQLLSHGQTRPDAPAVIECRRSDDASQRVHIESWSYAQLVGEVAAIAEQIARTTPADGVVVIALPNGFALTASFLATLAAGRTAFLMSPQLSTHEMTAAATGAGAALAIVSEVAASPPTVLPEVLSIVASALVGNAASRQTYDPALAHESGMFLRSSGTTGQARIVDRRAPTLDAVAANIARGIGHGDGRGLTPDDRVLGVIPQCHSYGVENALMGPLFAGAALVLCQGLDTALVNELWSRQAVSVFPATPSMLDMLARTGGASEADIFAQHVTGRSKLPCVYSAGAALPGSVALAFEQRYGTPVGQLYGASEAGSLTFIPGEQRPDPTCVGAPFTGVDLRIVQPDQTELIDIARGAEGEVAVRAPSMLSRYVGDPSLCTTDGYWRSGDLGRWDQKGRLHITGRRKFLIDVGPEKVNPLEIEGVLREHPGVADCVVVPVTVTETVCRLRAVVVRVAGAKTSGEELRQFLRERLIAYKVPRMYEFRTELPRSATGKVLRRDL